jgi:hypothetical protein
MYTARFRDDWSMKHFLHPKLLRKAREVRQQLEDIMKMQRMDITSAGTDFDLVRYVGLAVFRGLQDINVGVVGKRFVLVTSIRPPA